MSLSAFSWNVRGLCSEDKRQLFRSQLTDPLFLNSPDILFLQETHLPADLLTRGFNHSLSSRYYHLHIPAPRDDPYAGVSILVKISPKVKEFFGTLSDPGGRWAIAKMKHDDFGEITLLCVYAPATSPAARRVFFKSIPWDEVSSPRSIAAGDWNCILSPEDSCLHPAPGVSSQDPAPIPDPRSRVSDPDARTLSDHLQRAHLYDARSLLPAPASPAFSFQSSSAAGRTRSLLDRFYISSPLRRLAMSFSANTAVALSDHSPVHLSLQPVRVSRGPGLWRMNLSILPNRNMEALLAPIVNPHLNAPGPRDDAWYSRLLREVQQALRQVESEHRRKRGKDLLDARAKLAEADAALLARPNNPLVVAARRAACDAITAIEFERAKNRGYGRRLRWLKGAERPLAGFYRSTLPRRGRTSLIPPLAGAPDSSPAASLRIAHRFYRQLFSRRPASQADIDRMCSFIDKKLSDTDRDALAAPLDLEELEETASKMRNGTAPGPDGLPADLYKRAPCLIKVVFAIWEDTIDSNRQLPNTLLGSVISLIHKKGPTNQIENYRPIALRNVALKLITLAYTKRLNKIVGKIVGPQQTGFIPGRDIRNNILEVLLAHRAALRDNVSGAFIFLDFVKAYDKLSHEYILRVLEAMGFPPAFLKAVQLTLLAAAFTQININGHLTTVILLLCGVPQGDPLAPLLFVIATEPLRSALHKAPERGLVVAGVDLRGSLFADDTTGFAGSTAGFQRFMLEISCYCRASTSEVSFAKSSVLLFGRSPPEIDPRLRILQPGEFERVLGARIGRGRDRSPVWSQVEEKISAKLNHFDHLRHLSIFGRAQLANACILSHAWYFASFLPVREMALESLYKRSCHFVWRAVGGFKKTKFEFAKAPRISGGLGLLDPRLQVSAIQAHRIAALLRSPEDTPGRQLLWNALCELAPHRSLPDLLSAPWHDGRLPAVSHPTSALVADLLSAWSLLRPVGAPQIRSTPRIWIASAQRWGLESTPPFPTRAELADMRVCGDLQLADVSVKKIYRFLRAKQLADLQNSLTLALPSPPYLTSDDCWHLRWSWLATAVLPPKARQFLYLRWYNKLHLGERKDQPAQCPYCHDDDSIQHFCSLCPAIQPTLAYFLSFWRLHAPMLPTITLQAWLAEEIPVPHIAPPAPPPAEARSRERIRAATSADALAVPGAALRGPIFVSWTLLLHMLYCQRTKAACAAEPPPPAPVLTKILISAWRDSLLALLRAYASADSEDSYEMRHFPDWQAAIAAPGWYTRGSGQGSFKVNVLFPDPP